MCLDQQRQSGVELTTLEVDRSGQGCQSHIVWIIGDCLGRLDSRHIELPGSGSGHDPTHDFRWCRCAHGLHDGLVGLFQKEGGDHPGVIAACLDENVVA